MRAVENVVILGGSGYLGQIARRHFVSAGLTVHSLGSAQLDLTKSDALCALDEIVGDRTAVLFAAVASRSFATAQSFSEANRTMCLNTGAYLRRNPPALTVYLSSVSVYGRCHDQSDITEATPVDLDSPYASAKYEGEEIILANAARVLVLRVAQVYGPSDPHTTYGPTRFLRTITGRGFMSLFGDGEERRDFLYEEDFGRVLSTLVQSAQLGRVNLATGTSVAFAEVAAHLRRIVPFHFEIRHEPRQVPLVHQGFHTGKLRALIPAVEFGALPECLASTYAAMTRSNA